MKSMNRSPTKNTNSKKLLFELSEEQKQEIKQAFDVLEQERQNNCIPMKDLNIVLRALGFEVTKDEMNKIMYELNKGEEEMLRYEEFFEIMKKKFIEKDPYEELKNSFKLICEDETNKINLRSLQKIVKEMGETMSDEELKEMIKEANKGCDEEVCEEDFIKFMTKSTFDN